MTKIQNSKNGYISAVSVSKKKGTKKCNVSSAVLRKDCGIIGDAHAGPWHRQVSLLAQESIDKIKEKGLKVNPGDFAENITTEGITLMKLSLGNKIKAGKTAVLEITQIGKECHSRCNIYYQAGDCVMPKEGIFARVLSGGIIQPGDKLEVL